MFNKFHKKSSGKRAISPAISTVILTGAMVAILSVALVFANNLLWSRVAEGDFASSKQLMQSVGLQVDDVAWTTGRTETIRYATQYGDLKFEADVITYTIDVTFMVDDVEHVRSYDYSTGAVMFNLPTYRYSISDDYWARIYPDPDTALTLTGTSAPVARVFAIERTPMPDGKYIRVVTAPSIRVLNSSISTSTNSTLYIKAYLPVLTAGESPRLIETLTLTGESINAHTVSNVSSLTVSVAFPREDTDDFDSAFFNFPTSSQNIDIPTGYDNVVFEFYVSEVSVAFGVS